MFTIKMKYVVYLPALQYFMVIVCKTIGILSLGICMERSCYDCTPTWCKKAQWIIYYSFEAICTWLCFYYYFHQHDKYSISQTMLFMKYHRCPILETYSILSFFTQEQNLMEPSGMKNVKVLVVHHYYIWLNIPYNFAVCGYIQCYHFHKIEFCICFSNLQNCMSTFPIDIF